MWSDDSRACCWCASYVQYHMYCNYSLTMTPHHLAWKWSWITPESPSPNTDGNLASVETLQPSAWVLRRIKTHIVVAQPDNEVTGRGRNGGIRNDTRSGQHKWDIQLRDRSWRSHSWKHGRPKCCRQRRCIISSVKWQCDTCNTWHECNSTQCKMCYFRL